ncbi:MAG: GIY-YIG nuclease family protein [Bryobacteraceae bacterium]
MDEALRFSEAVAGKLRHYVHRLIDPRNGETFYVGKGIGNRVFAHVKGELGADADILADKLQRIRDRSGG